jgi:hypothetical protein
LIMVEFKYLWVLMVVLDDEMASLIAPEFGFEPHVDAVAAFDLFPQYASL